MSESADDRQCCRKHGEGEVDHSGFAADSSRLWSLHGGELVSARPSIS